MSKYIFDPEVYREKPMYGVISEVIKLARKRYADSRAREMGVKETKYVSDFLEASLDHKFNVRLSGVIIEKCQTIEDIINYIKYVKKRYGGSYYFDETKMNNKR